MHDGGIKEWTIGSFGTFPKFNVRLSQNADHYVKDLEPVPLSPQRKKKDHLIAGNKLLQKVDLDPMPVEMMYASRATEGIFIDLTRTAMIHGDECKSPNVAKEKALCDSEDEMLGPGSPGNDKDEMCAEFPAGLATDSRTLTTIWVKLRLPWTARTSLKDRWVNGDAPACKQIYQSYGQASINCQEISVHTEKLLQANSLVGEDHPYGKQSIQVFIALHHPRSRVHAMPI